MFSNLKNYLFLRLFKFILLFIFIYSLNNSYFTYKNISKTEKKYFSKYSERIDVLKFEKFIFFVTFFNYFFTIFTI